MLPRNLIMLHAMESFMYIWFQCAHYYCTTATTTGCSYFLHLIITTSDMNSSYSSWPVFFCYCYCHVKCYKWPGLPLYIHEVPCSNLGPETCLATLTVLPHLPLTPWTLLHYCLQATTHPLSKFWPSSSPAPQSPDFKKWLRGWWNSNSATTSHFYRMSEATSFSQGSFHRSNMNRCPFKRQFATKSPITC
jgi:hypothetical protein